MTTVEPPPQLGDEEEGLPAQRAIEPEAPASQFRFSMTRLIIATAMAPLPLLLIHPAPRHEKYAWCFVLSCFTLFATVLWIKARDLPRLNLAVFFMALPGIMMIAPVAIPVFAILFAVPAMFLAGKIFPRSGNEERCVLKCNQVLKSAAYLLVTIYFFAWVAITICFTQRPAHFSIGLVGMFVLGALVPVNFYWIATCPDQDLDQRPELAFWFETTMVLIPAAVLFATLRVIRIYI
ncbi:hypothetical protein LOC68_19835 [Blastopirellula sp. JC732]|uniref:Transmembrane protein n=1 Tax=Blastopirellula sediminis TaxID=2894196 RepID=A0A9X1MRE9_9BACT|nr:hypothetical protein [Blastopirellula sediminis]MCC9606049.1 hypothetical protein [Blastopirellula sediminis]MCC9630652.1 hypothetical protein [Blastopirellula sediminis]